MFAAYKVCCFIPKVRIFNNLRVEIMVSVRSLSILCVVTKYTLYFKLIFSYRNLLSRVLNVQQALNLMSVYVYSYNVYPWSRSVIRESHREALYCFCSDMK